MALHQAILLMLVLLPTVCGNGFLARDSTGHFESARSELGGSIADVLGRGHGIDAARMTRIRHALAVLFRSLPQTQQGTLSAAVMRYAVQRYFRQQHGWVIKGFEPHAPVVNASAWADGAPILQSKVPDFVRSVLEAKHSHKGFALEDGVLMIATLERLILDEVVRGVERAYGINEVDATEALSPDSFTDVFTSYFIMEMLQVGAGSKNSTFHRAKKANIRRIYPHWDEAERFLTDVFLNDFAESKHTLNPFVRNEYRFEDVVRLAGRVNQAFGPFANHECDIMKDALSSMDPYETGRVKMSDFYNSAKGGTWQFEEGFDYLRQTGAIDQSSEVLGAQVIIPNYIAGMNNCITNKYFFSICCMDECDSVYQHLEAAIPTAYASAAEILTVVEEMVIPARDAKNLSAVLRSRLEDIAAVHDDHVPLHGRLMSQWLHFVFPRDCPYPHVVGTTDPKTPANYESINGAGTSDVTVSEVEQFLQADSANLVPSPDAGQLMWNFQEVLLDTNTLSDVDGEYSSREALRIIVLFGFVASLIVLGVNEASRIFSVLRPEVKAVQYIV